MREMPDLRCARQWMYPGEMLTTMSHTDQVKCLECIDPKAGLARKGDGGLKGTGRKLISLVGL